jgi:branched-chain amino acid transport system substrate-binding protein
MTARTATLGILAAAVLAAAACGGDGGGGGAAVTGPPARAVSVPTCSPVTYGGPGRPRFLIVNSSPYQGLYKGHGVQTAQAMKMMLAQRDWRAGPYPVGIQTCEETDAATGLSSPALCRRNAHAFAENPSVLGLIGPFTSTCAALMLPILNRAPGGPLATISGGNTYVGLTRSGAGTLPGEPERYVPTGRRGYARMSPTDDVQGAAVALLAQRMGVRRAFVLDDGSSYGRGLATAYGAAARRLGLSVVGTARWKASERNYRALARRIRATRPQTVFVAGQIVVNGPQLIADLTATLGRGVHVMAGDGFNQLDPLVEAAGPNAEGIRISISVVPTRKLPAAGRRFAAEFERRFSQRPCCYSVHEAQATAILLDAIAHSGGSRARVAENVMRTRVRGGLVGDFAFDRNGDTTLNTEGIYRIQGGKLVFETAITPAADLLGRE